MDPDKPDPGWKDWQYWSMCEKYGHEYVDGDGDYRVCADCGDRYESEPEPEPMKVGIRVKIGKPA